MSRPNKDELIILPVQEPSEDTPDYQGTFTAPETVTKHPEYELPEAEKIVKPEVTAEEVTEALKKTLSH